MNWQKLSKQAEPPLSSSLKRPTAFQLRVLFLKEE